MTKPSLSDNARGDLAAFVEAAYAACDHIEECRLAMVATGGDGFAALMAVSDDIEAELRAARSNVECETGALAADGIEPEGIGQ